MALRKNKYRPQKRTKRSKSLKKFNMVKTSAEASSSIRNDHDYINFNPIVEPNRSEDASESLPGCSYQNVTPSQYNKTSIDFNLESSSSDNVEIDGVHFTPTETEAATANKNTNFGMTEKNSERNEFSFISQKEYDEVMNHDLYYEPTERPSISSILSGNRIVNLAYVLNWAVKLQHNHTKICTSGELYVTDEVRWGTGLDPKSERSKINYGAVWGTLATGSTYSHLEEWLCVMDIPPMTVYKFKQIEDELADQWKDSLINEIEKNGKEEKKLAIQAGNIDPDGIPFITVYVDGGWSKRSYGHSYNASSGTAVIIGKASGKLVFLGVRNKYCCICARAANKRIAPSTHLCYKNWMSSSAAMEADIVVEGFCKSIEMHGVRYKTFVADGDSSVFAKIREKVPYGQFVEKIECSNHVIKNFGKALRTMKNDKQVSFQARKILTCKIMASMQKRVHGCLYDNALGDVEQLKRDISNAPLHVFGDHRNCREIYCEELGAFDEERSTRLKSSGLLLHLNAVLDNVIKKAHKLINNETNNMAEIFMAVLCRFNAGKRLNLTQRRSFETRSHLAGLRYDKGATWHYSPWKCLMKESPGAAIKAYISKKASEKERSNVVQKRKRPTDSFSNSGEASSNNLHYGPEAEDAEPSEEELKSEMQRKLSEMQISDPEEQAAIAEQTTGQFENQLYLVYRKNRLTASHFGNVVKRLPTTPCHSLVKTILMPNIISSAAMEYGKKNEALVRERFATENKTGVRECGLFIDLQKGFLAASPDGLLGKDGLIEIKCLYKVAQSGETLRQAVENKNVPCLEINRNNELSLKKNHNYYYQIQGQLNITGRTYCIFIVYSGDHNPLFTERLQKDTHFWLEKMLPKLDTFYLDCVLPEIVRGNLKKNKLCVDPPYILAAIEKKKEKVKRKLQSEESV